MKSILAIDGLPSMRQLFSYTLESAGYEVFLAEDSIEALSIAQNTDVKMSGVAPVKNLRQLYSHSYKPTFILTTEFSTEEKIQGKKISITDKFLSIFRRSSINPIITRE